MGRGSLDQLRREFDLLRHRRAWDYELVMAKVSFFVQKIDVAKGI
jgi:hypothetical protein